MEAWLEIPSIGRVVIRGECSIGRLPDNSVVLDDTKVSRRHAMILAHGPGAHWLVDFGSSNGMLLNQRRLTEPARLKNGDQIRIEQTLMVFREELTGPVPVGPDLDETRFPETERRPTFFAESDHGAIFLTSDGVIRSVSDNARRWLREFFSSEAGTSEVLPRKIQEWWSLAGGGRGGGHPLQVELDGRRLSIRLGDLAGSQKLLLLTEERPVFSVESLTTLGLTQRESEVLHWISEGKSNGEIAVILGLSVRTVERHVQQIMGHLGATSRSVAVATALRRLHHPGT